MYMESGCQLRVTSAEPGSKLFLRFTARPGGEQNVTLRMPRNSSTDTLMITSGFGSDGLPSIEGTAEYLGFPSTRVPIGRTDPDLTITEATCRCKRHALFWEECTINASYLAKFDGEHLTDFVVHSAALNDDHVFKLLASKDRRYMSAKLRFNREEMGSLSLTMGVWPLYIFASAPCVN
ncbi:hypothetical protein QBZ16_004125 [Prototheca wickerhamii]|uniref:Uncharacterized protein n=1 Tax=Prototheca wickerhamii TaxID=3111 RepID=A0AAD9MN89_PROWI|nr:hypothetical protein QBZ16_004125 [Prototheca wickerhamii]